MNAAKEHALAAYYYATLPWRRWQRRREEQRGTAPLMVLFYHRVADEHPNDWTIDTASFIGQMRWLAERFDLVSLEEVQRRMRAGKNHRAAVAITFDDGYADNCREALPWLIEHKIPCTYFVTTRNVLQGEPFPHDVANGQPLAPNNLEQLRAMSAAGIEIGAHTQTHADLGQVTSADQLREEVVIAGELLQSAIGQTIRYFAFPYGLHANLCSAAFHLADEHGYEACCSAYGGFNRPGDDPFHLQRIHGDPELIRLKNWVTGDPRKRNIPRFDYQVAASLSSSTTPEASLR